MSAPPTILPLKLDNVSFEANGKRLLDRISFTLPQGGITVTVGPNGAGKSLTLRLCHGLLSPSAGQVCWHGDQEAGHAKRHAMLFQRPVMLRRSVRANIAHALGAVGHPANQKRTQAALTRFGLQPLVDQPARLLSGGEQQRLAIARAWALEPEVLFLDEPTSQLDPGATRQIEQLIEDLANEGVTILMTTHDLGQAKRLSQRVLFLNKGRLLEDSTTSAFFAEPSTAEARAFIAGDLLW